MPIEPLGIDNVLFDVADLDAAVALYERCGFRLRWRSVGKGIALFAIGPETPGLLRRRQTSTEGTGRPWVEVADANSVAVMLEAEGIQSIRIETTTGITCEVCDPFGNRIGFGNRAFGRRS